MRNEQIAAALSELATLYEIDGAIAYRVIAYRDAAKAIAESGVSVAALAKEGRLKELAGVGKTLEEKILALLETGEIPAAAKLKETYPPGLVELTRLPGLGAKRVRRLFEELGVASLDDLRAAAQAQRIRELAGMGQKVEENLLAALASLPDGDAPARRLLSEVLPVAEALAEALRSHPDAVEVEIAGSVRRQTETCKDIDLIATSEAPAALVSTLAGHELVAELLASGPGGGRVLTHTGIAADLRVVEPRNFGNLLQHFSGSQAHNVALREEAIRRGFSVSEHGITVAETGEVIACGTEAEVYAKLGYDYIEPELREGHGELEAAASGGLPERLVELGDLRGDLHCHTTLSDGRNSLEEMAHAARELGYGYLALTDHSASHGFGNNVTAEALAARIEEVRSLQGTFGRLRLLAGSEVNIGTDGSLDYPDELLAELDWVIASVHTSFRISEQAMTERVLAAIEHPLVDCIGHLTGRLLLRRQPYALDFERIAEAAAANGTMLEINANPNRRDLSEAHARIAADAGVRIVINTDAHGVDMLLANMRWGVATARRAWLERGQIANTRPWSQFAKLRKRPNT